MTPQQWCIVLVMMRKMKDDRDRALQINAMNRAERDRLYNAPKTLQLKVYEGIEVTA